MYREKFGSKSVIFQIVNQLFHSFFVLVFEKLFFLIDYNFYAQLAILGLFLPLNYTSVFQDCQVKILFSFAMQSQASLFVQALTE